MVGYIAVSSYHVVGISDETTSARSFTYPWLMTDITPREIILDGALKVAGVLMRKNTVWLYGDVYVYSTVKPVLSRGFNGYVKCPLGTGVLLIQINFIYKITSRTGWKFPCGSQIPP